jgi:hypothetical protein
MYATNERVLRGLRSHRGVRGLGRLGSDTAIGAAAGSAVAPGIGTAIGGLIGSLFGGGTSVQNPGGPAAFARWAKEGHFDWVASVALTMSGPDWSKDPNDTGSPWKTGYSPADAQSASAVLTQYHLTPQQASAAPVGSAASQAALTGTTSTAISQLTGGVPLTTAGITSLISNPLVLVGIGAVILLSQRRGRR